MLQKVTKDTEIRWMKIIDALMKPDSDLTKNELAKIIGINRQTLWRDMSEPRFKEMLDEYIQIRMDNDVVAKALSNIFAEVMRGDVSISKWFLEYRIKLQDISAKSLPATETIEGEFQEITETALAKSNGNTGRIIDLLNELNREVGE